MPRHCSVKGCKSNYTPGEDAVSTFSLPRDEKLKAEWLKKIPTDFSGLKHPIVCIKHFSESDIIRVYKCTVKGELKIFPRKIPKLKEGTVPCIFQTVPKYFDDIKSVHKKLSNMVEQQLDLAIAGNLKSDQEFIRGVLPVKKNKPNKKLKRDAVPSQNLPDRTLRRNAKRRKRRNPGARKLNIDTETVWLPCEGISVNTEVQENMESGDCPVFFQEIGEPEEIFFKTELLTKIDNKEYEGNPLLETIGESQAVFIKTEPFTDENREDEQIPQVVDAIELRIKEEPEDSTVQTEYLMETNLETVIVKEEITFEEFGVHLEESSTEYECPDW